MTHRHPIIPSGAARASDAADQFGQRYLRDEEAVFEFNAWDDVEWPEEKEQEALETIERQRAKPVPDEEVPTLIDEADAKWEEFYSTHTNRFFMDRKWIAREFPELLEGTSGDGPIHALDVGCGVGNTTFPLLQSNPRLYMHSCDFSATAIDILRGNELFDAQRCDPFVWDITAETDHIEPGSLDYVLCIYVLSAIPPEKQWAAVRNLVRLLKPGGMLLVKDYGRHDLTQLRFKAQRFIADNFYRRGDGTLVYFFTPEELDDLFTQAGLTKRQNHVDKRLVVNRAKKVKMYRRWMQCKYVKEPVLSS